MIIIITITFSNNYIITITFLRLNISNDYILRNLTYLSVDFNQALIIKTIYIKMKKIASLFGFALLAATQALKMTGKIRELSQAEQQLEVGDPVPSYSQVNGTIQGLSTFSSSLNQSISASWGALNASTSVINSV